MIRIVCLCLALVASMFVSMAALAQTPAEQAVAFCEARHPGTDSAARLRQVLCIQDQNTKILAAEQARQRRELEAIRAARPTDVPAATPSANVDAAAAREAIRARAAELKGKQASMPATPSVAQPILPPPPPVVGGVPYRVVPTPGKFAATTYDVHGARLRIWALQEGVDRHVRGANEVRIIVKRDSMPLVIDHTGGVINPIRADLNGDGREDLHVVYSAVDPFLIDTIYIPQVGPRTEIELIFLVPTGDMIEVPGFTPAQFWGEPVRVKYEVPPRLGRFETKANFGWSL